MLLALFALFSCKKEEVKSSFPESFGMEINNPSMDCGINLTVNRNGDAVHPWSDTPTVCGRFGFDLSEPDKFIDKFVIKIASKKCAGIQFDGIFYYNNDTIKFDRPGTYTLNVGAGFFQLKDSYIPYN